QHDRPAHTEMRKVVHGYFTPNAMEAWRPLVQKVIKDLLDEVEVTGHMDVMRDLATPLPVLVIAQMLGLPDQDRPFLRGLAQKLLFIGRGDLNRMGPLTEGINGLWSTSLPSSRSVACVQARTFCPSWRTGRLAGPIPARKWWRTPCSFCSPATRPPSTSSAT